jgi:hypothetical protein
MNERGQVFTLDMFFALTLTVLVVSYSGLALEQARRQAESYALRYSLERTANDAADVLIRTSGRPSNWENDPRTLKTLGLAVENRGVPVWNTLDNMKVVQLRRLTENRNWTDPANASAVRAVRELFGDSDNFEIRGTHTGLLARWELAEDDDNELETTLFGVEVRVEAENQGGVMRVEIELGWNGFRGRWVERVPEFVLVVEGGGILVEAIVRAGVVEIWYTAALWTIWPGWDVEVSSGVENSLEVAVVRRLVAMRFGAMLPATLEVKLWR